MRLSPTPLGNRIEAIDMIRGISLLGILVANLLYFNLPYLYIDPFSYFSEPSDVTVFTGIRIFVEGSFYPIFAVLFGYGLNMQYEKAVATRSPFAPVMARRLGIMALFGILHALFLWFGDILLTYALMGFIMIACVRIPKKWLLPLAAVLYVIPSGIMYIGIYLMNKFGAGESLQGYADIQKIEQSISVYAHGSYGEIFLFRFFEWVIYGLSTTLVAVFFILPLIMIGAGLSKWKFIEHAGEMKGKILIGTIIALVVGILLKAVPFFNEPTLDAITLQTQFGGPILAAGYVGALLLLWQLPLFRTVFRPIAKAGRMSLTTYIMQTVIATTIFYAYGFGLYGKVDMVTLTWIGVGVFAIQVIFAELWLTKFKMGPLEWVWRKATYGKSSSNKEEKSSPLS